jgi:TetR/AcrR family transcriptional regulator, regulator of autoinduction and epiphytic fitness
MPDRVKKRAYVSPARQAKAEATKARIIGAAAKLFLDRGYARTSTAAIGRAANTSEASVFAVFGSKADLLVAVVADHVVRHPDFPLRDSPAWPRFAQQTDKRPAIEEFARVTRGAHDRSWRLLAVAAAAAHDDPVVATAVARGAARRHADCAWLLREVIGMAEPELGRTADEVWTLVSVENYRHLVIERSWPPEQYESWLAEMLTATLR